jgi:hypothetical protein
MDLNRDLNTKDAYFSYLLRIWCLEKSEGLPSSKENLWRVSLENTQSRACVTFTSLEEMLVFLKVQFEQMYETSDQAKRKNNVNRNDHEVEPEKKRSKDSEVPMTKK